MLDILVKWVFKVINKLISTIFNPIVSGITALFPSTATIFTNIISFLGYALTYVSNVCEFLCIPNTILVLLFSYFEIKFTIHLIVIATKGTINLYNYLKP